MREKPNAEDIRVSSEKLAELRVTIDRLRGMTDLIGAVVQVVVVVDANIILGDLIWMASKRTSPSAKTSLLESSVAGTLVACVPPYAIEEVQEKIPEVAKKRKIDGVVLARLWEEYRAILRVEEPDPIHVEKYRKGRDPKDADYLALADTLAAKGILSRDKDISAMGGAVISMEAVTLLRDYSRAAAVEFNIKVNGCYSLMVGIVTLKIALEVLDKAAGQVARIPGWAKGLLLCILFIALMNENARNKLGEVVGALRNAMSSLAPQIWDLVLEVHADHDVNKKKAEACLNKLLEIIPSLEGGYGKKEKV
jgi:predicted nucleic acid-binding protein